jgi:predicted N-acyltransferase
MTGPEIRIRVLSSISEIPATEWNACANPRDCSVASNSIGAESISQPPPYNPFISHEFLHALEASGSATGRTGWQPQHLVMEDDAGVILGAAPCYLKSHSQGEYVFDWGWADAFERAGGNYYPKLQVSVPFTPATGPRLLVRAGEKTDVVRAGLAAGLTELCRMREASSVHLTFLPKPEADLLAARGFLQRTDQQFHWNNEGYGTFDDFLAALASRKRKAIRRERAEAVENGIEIEWLTGPTLTEGAWDAFFGFYTDTGSRKWGRPYLTRKFFSQVSASMAARILLVMAKREGRYIAGALNFIGGDALYGRHWGAIEHHPFLHFELCYYQAIAFAIEHKLARVEAGAQGEHKLARGYLPVITHSAHYIANPGLRRAVADFLRRERAEVAAISEVLTEAGPFRKQSDA